MRLALFQMGQETDTFNPSPTTIDDFDASVSTRATRSSTARGPTGRSAGSSSPSTRPRRDIETVPLSRGWAGSRRADHASRLCASSRIGSARPRARAGPIDGLALHLHGACAAEGVDDVEGRLLAIRREVLGLGVPIVLTLDHHANVTRAMIDLSRRLVGFRTHPHDPLETAEASTSC